MEMEKGVQRWAVDISNWKPSSHQFLAAMSLLPDHERSTITRFAKSEDRIRALVSRLLQYALVHHVLGIPLHKIVIRRTPQGKPFLVSDNQKLRFKNFNYNVSHHGDYVAIASEPICLVGLDIVSQYIPVNESAGEFISNFSPYFSCSEWSHISNAGSSDEMLDVFYKYWCLKEAFVKAIGSGVGYKLDNIEFHHTNWGKISVEVSGKELKDWKFWLLELGPNHSRVSIARGHPMSAILNYNTTPKGIEFDEKECSLGLNLPNKSFQFVTVEDLVRVWHSAQSVCIVSREPCASADEGETDNGCTFIDKTF